MPVSLYKRVLRKKAGDPKYKSVYMKATSKKAQAKKFATRVKRVIGRAEETKYNATTIWDKATLDGAIHSIGLPGTNSDTMPLVPKIAVGTLEHERVGRKISPTKACIDVNLSFTQTGDPPFAQATQQIFVHMFLLRSKTWKSYGKMQTDGGAYKNFADNGDSTSGAFGTQDGSGNWFTNVLSFQRPVNTSALTQIKRVRIKLTKNQGIINGSAVPNAVTNLQTTSYSGRYYFKLPKLEYDDTDATHQGYPSNCNVFVSVGSALSDNTDGLSSANGGLITISGRLHVWYKDA